jgi:hypothetical protein
LNASDRKPRFSRDRIHEINVVVLDKDGRVAKLIDAVVDGTAMGGGQRFVRAFVVALRTQDFRRFRFFPLGPVCAEINRRKQDTFRGVADARPKDPQRFASQPECCVTHVWLEKDGARFEAGEPVIAAPETAGHGEPVPSVAVSEYSQIGWGEDFVSGVEVKSVVAIEPDAVSIRVLGYEIPPL